MLRNWIAVLGAMALVACGPSAPHDFPESAHAQFSASCPASDPVCACTWEQITREMTAEDYQAAVDRFRREGLMDHRITHARTVCVEQHPHAGI